MSAAEQTLKADVRIIGLVALAHGLSHFFQMATAVVFPLIKDDLDVSYAALGATVALYYTMSGVFQTVAGFAVDKLGARKVLFFGLILSASGALLAGLSHNYPMLVLAAFVGGIGNSVFHPCDFSILNARVGKERLGHAFSWHGIAGFLGYAAAPTYAIGMVGSFGWRGALLGAAALGFALIAVFALQRDARYVEPADARRAQARGGFAEDLKTLGSAPILMCFGYFLLLAVGFIAIQTFGVATMISLYGASAQL